MQSVGRQAVQHAQRPRLQISAEGRIAEFKWNDCATLVNLALQSYLGAETGFATAACEVWVVQLKEADGVSSGKAASSGKVEVMRKRFALQEVPLAWEEDRATVLGCGSAGPMPHSVGAKSESQRVDSCVAPVICCFLDPLRARDRF